MLVYNIISDFLYLYSANSVTEFNRGSVVSPEFSEDGCTFLMADMLPKKTRAISLDRPQNAYLTQEHSRPEKAMSSLCFLSHEHQYDLLATHGTNSKAMKRARPDCPVSDKLDFPIDKNELEHAVAKAAEIENQNQYHDVKRRRINVENKTVDCVEVCNAVPPSPEQNRSDLFAGIFDQMEDEEIQGQAKFGTAAERRRERNRVLAQKSRQKKKNMFESLQNEVFRLNRENELLKAIVKAKFGVLDLDDVLNNCDKQQHLSASDGGNYPILSIG